MIFKILFSSLFAFAGPTFDVFIRDVDIASEVQRDYRDIRAVVLDLFNVCPPDDCLFVGFEQNATPILALIEAVQGNEAIRFLPLNTETLWTEWRRPGVETGFRSHAQHFLGTPQSIKKHRIVVVDASLKRSVNIVEMTKQLKAYYGDDRVVGYALTNFADIGGFMPKEFLRSSGIQIKEISDRFASRLLHHTYASLYPYPRFEVAELARMPYVAPPVYTPNRFPKLVDAFVAETFAHGPTKSFGNICLGILRRIGSAWAIRAKR